MSDKLKEIRERHEKEESKRGFGVAYTDGLLLAHKDRGELLQMVDDAQITIAEFEKEKDLDGLELSRLKGCIAELEAQLEATPICAIKEFGGSPCDEHTHELLEQVAELQQALQDKADE